MFKFCVIISLLIACIESHKVEPISSEKWIEGYGLVWDEELERLLFVDVFNDTISCYDVKTKRSFEAVLPGNSVPTYVIKLKNQRHQYLVGNSRIAVVIEWNCRKGEVKFVRRVFKVEPEPRFIANSFHIATASPNGKFFVGGTFRGALCVNISSPNASYYTYSRKTGVKRLNVLNLVTTGGVAFSPNGKKVYLVDLCNGLVWEYDFNSKTGDISNGVIVFKYLKNFGGPLSCILGITSDTDGKLYLAIWNGGVVLKVNPRTKQIELVINIPVKLVATVGWGGKNNDILFVTTSIPFFDISTAAVYDYYPPSYSPTDSGKVFAVTKLDSIGVKTQTIKI